MSICLKCLGSTSGRCPEHSLTFYPGPSPIVGTEPFPITGDLSFADMKAELPIEEQEIEDTIYSALAGYILCPGDAEHRASARKLRKRLKRLAKALSPQVRERVAAKICRALQGIPGLLVTNGRIWLVSEDEVPDWDEVEDCGLRYSQINAVLVEDEAVDCAEFVGRTVREP